MTSDALGEGRRRAASSSSLNPGISAAGSAARRTALDPSSGPAAIGGMLSTSAVDPTPEETSPEIRLTIVVTEITKLANAVEALSIGLAGLPPGVRRESAT